WKPVRIELYSDELGYLDIHPFVLSEDGTSKQADLEGGWYEFEKDYFGSAFFVRKNNSLYILKRPKSFPFRL
ncbi:lincosamide resistance protein, partial [human gut metagenome]